MMFVKVRSPADSSNFDTYPKEKELPPDELSGWDIDFQLCNWSNHRARARVHTSNKTTTTNTYYYTHTYTRNRTTRRPARQAIRLRILYYYHSSKQHNIYPISLSLSLPQLCFSVFFFIKKYLIFFSSRTGCVSVPQVPLVCIALLLLLFSCRHFSLDFLFHHTCFLPPISASRQAL